MQVGVRAGDCAAAASLVASSATSRRLPADWSFDSQFLVVCRVESQLAHRAGSDLPLVRGRRGDGEIFGDDMVAVVFVRKMRRGE